MPRDGAQGVVNLTTFGEKLTLIRHQFERVFQHINSAPALWAFSLK